LGDGKRAAAVYHRWSRAGRRPQREALVAGLAEESLRFWSYLSASTVEELRLVVEVGGTLT
jgi:hypothetical protein